MILETKYNPGDTLFIIFNNEIVKANVLQVSATTTFLSDGELHLQEKYYMSVGRDDYKDGTWYLKKDVFESIDDLVMDFKSKFE